MDEEVLPLEACILLSKYINMNKDCVSVDINYFNSMIIDSLYTRIDFNISGKILLNYINDISDYYIDKHKIILLNRKFNNLKHIKIHSNISTLVGIKINNFNKMEIFNYIPQLENYIYIIDEDIKLLNFNNGQNINEFILKDIIRESTSKNERIFTYSSYLQNKHIDINNDYERMMVYEVTKEIYEKKAVISKDSLLSKVIIDNINLFSDTYKNTIYKIIIQDTKSIINKGIDELRKNPNNGTLKDLINKSNNTEEIFTIIKLAEAILDKINLENYVEAIYKCYYLEKDNLISEGNKRSIALFCEELISSTPIVFTEVIDILKEMYNENIFTDKTLDTLKYIKHTVNDKKNIEEIILKCKYSNNNFDNEFIEIICEMENEYYSDNKNILDEMLNKFIYNVNDFTLYDNRIIGCIYRFYKRNNDRNTLLKLCKYAYKNNLQLKSLNFDIKDIETILRMYNIKNKKDDVDFRLKIINEYREDEKILKYGKVLLENIYNKSNDNIIRLINENYSELFKVLRKNSDKLFEAYIQIIQSNSNILNENNIGKDDIEEMILILNKKNVIKTTKVNILKVLIDYFILNNDTNEMISYMQIYINRYSDVDNGKLFKSIIYNHSKNIKFLEDLLTYIDFNIINNAEIFLQTIADNLYSVQKVNLIPEILKYFIDNEKYEESIDILKKYIAKSYKVGNIIKNNNFEIDEMTYEIVIDPILSNIDLLSKKEIYGMLVKRDDLAIRIRHKYFRLCPSQENKSCLMEGFLNRKIDSLKVKEFAADFYFNDDKKFCEIINIGDYFSNEIYDLVYKKCVHHFENNKEYVYELLKNIYTENKKLSELYDYCQSYMDTCFDLEEKIIFGFYKCIKREKGYGRNVDKLYLENIFDEDDKIEGILFVDKENILFGLMRQYWDKLNIDYTVIDEDIVIINEKQSIEFISKEDGINKLIDNLKLLIELQRNLINNGKLIIEFTDKSVIANEKGFILCSFDYLCNYESEFKIKNTTLFKDIPEINIGRYTKINEQNICIILRRLIKSYLFLANEEYSTMGVIQKFEKYVLNSNDIITYDEFILKLNKFKEDESKTFEEITYRSRLEKFNVLEEFEKTDVVEEIILRKDTTLIAKRIAIYFEGVIFNTDAYISYIIDCFNNSNTGLEENDIVHIYETVNKHISEMDRDTCFSIKNELFNFYINAKELYKIYSEDLKDDISKLKIYEDDKSYLLSRI